MTKPLLVTGMHRSHTSLVCQWLQNCGLSFGDNLMEATVSNQKGHFENLDIVAFHNRLLEHNDIHIYPKQKELSLKIPISAVPRIQNVIEKIGDGQVGVKDPRAALFLEDLWLKAFPDLTIVFCIRHPLQVIESLVEREEKRNDDREFFFGVKWHLMKGKWVNRFANAYKLYNQQAIQIATKYPDQIVVVDLYSIKNFGEQCIAELNQRGFTLNYQNFGNTFDENLTSSSVYQALNDKMETEMKDFYLSLKEIRSF